MTSYAPGLPPADLEDLVVFLNDELLKLSEIITSNSVGAYEVLYSPPLKYRVGTVVYADGTSWNPGSGEGLYRYDLANTWVYIG